MKAIGLERDAMIYKIKRFYENNTIGIYLGIHTLISLLLAVVVIMIDSKYIPILEYIPDVFLTSVELAKLILSTLTGALLTMTTFTFSTIIVVLTMYSSDFSPRVVNNFLTDKTTIRVLGMFVGGFFYCILALFFMRKSFSQYLVLSATIAVIYSVLCVIYFVVFIYRVASSIQMTKLISKIYDESCEIIERALKYRKNQMSVETYDVGIFESRKDIRAYRSGYLESIEFKDILSILKDVETKLFIEVDIGDFVAQNQKIGTLYYNETLLDDAIIDKILKQFSIEEERMAYNDYRFSLEKIIDVALRAISPGINDPNTAIHCINILGVLLSKLGEIKGTYTVIKNDWSKSEVIYEDFNFKEDLYYTFYQLVNYGKGDISVVVAMLNALKIIKQSASSEKESVIEMYGDYIYENSISNFTHLLDIEVLQTARQSI